MWTDESPMLSPQNGKTRHITLIDPDKQAPEVAISMFSVEIITKLVLYYLHERIWIKSNWGVVKQKN